MIKLIKSTFFEEKKTKERLIDFIRDAKILSMGKYCKKFENEFSRYQGRKYSVFFNSGSSANLALIQSLLNLNKINKKDKIGFSALTWATNAMPLIQLGLETVPIDISLRTLNVTSDNLRDVLEKTKLNALFLTNLLGFSGDINIIKKICEERNILLLEDNCESLGSEVNGTKLGNFGLASTFSFFVGHHMSTIEGGMVCTDDKNLYNMLLMVRAHGWDRNLDLETQKKLRNEYKVNDFYSNYTFYYLGYNFRPTELNGFLGLEQLQYLNKIIHIREKNFQLFNKEAKKNDDFYSFDLSHMNFISNFAYPIICKNEELFRKYTKKFEDNNIELRPIVGGAVTQQPFYNNLEKTSNKCEFAERVHKLGFYIPNNPELTEVELNLIKGLLKII